MARTKRKRSSEVSGAPAAAPNSTPAPTRPATGTESAPAGYTLEQLEPSAPPPLGTPARVLAEAHAEAQRIREQARTEGHEEGRAQGREEGIAETLAAGAALRKALAELQRQSEEIAEAVERDAIELGLQLAGKILPAALLAQPEVVAYAVAGRAATA